MKKFLNLHDAISFIESQIKFKTQVDLNILKVYVESLNLEHLMRAKKVHVAGTNGKGSTTKMMSLIAMAHGLKVGTFMSPYLVVFNERILINNVEISDDDLLRLLNRAYEINTNLIATNQPSFSFFELITIVALIYFNEQQVDLIVMEVGIGGLYDATNILNYDVSLITNIGTDHLNRLGPTIQDVARNKLGILKPKGHLITTVDASLKNFFKSYADQLKATVYFVKERHLFTLSNDEFMYEGQTFKLKLIGDYQRFNASLAIEASYFLFDDITYEAIYKGLYETTFHGRFEKVDTHIYMDGAHNLESAIALKRNILYQFHNKKVYYLMSMLADKDITRFLDVFKGENIILTSFPDIRFKDLSSYQTEQIQYIEDVSYALEHIKTQMKDDDVLMITGSLHFIGYLKQTIFK